MSGLRRLKWRGKRALTAAAVTAQLWRRQEGKKKDGAGGFGLRHHLQVSGSGGSRTSQFEESLLLFPVKAHELAIEVEQGIIWSDDDILKLNKVEVMCAQFVLLADHAFK